jgi:hypothetical protein
MTMTAYCPLPCMRKSSLLNSWALITWNNSSPSHRSSNKCKISLKCVTRWPNSGQRSRTWPLTKTWTDCKTCKPSNKFEKRQRKQPHQCTTTHTPKCWCCTAKTITFFSKSMARPNQEWNKIFYKWTTSLLCMSKLISWAWSTEQGIVREEFGTDLALYFSIFSFLNCKFHFPKF